MLTFGIAAAWPESVSLGVSMCRAGVSEDPGLLPYMSDQAPDINDPAGGATHDRNADILGKNRRNDLSVYGHFGPRRRGPIAKKDIIYPSELARRHVSGACLFEVQPAT